MLTENVAILSWIAEQAPALAPKGPLGKARLLEMLAFISTEVHKQFGRVFRASGEAEAQAARDKIGQRLDLLAKQLDGDYLFGQEVTVADAYLFVMLLWAQKVGLAIPPRLSAFSERMKLRPAVSAALQHEGIA